MTIHDSMSSRETAHTEQIDYTTSDCQVCGTEVSIDEVPRDVFERRAYAVVLGEGEINRKLEKQGNWDVEHRFSLEKQSSRSPMVRGYIICEDCASTIHGFDVDRGEFTSSIPPEIQSATGRSGENASVQTKMLIIVFAIMLFVLIILIL